MKRAELEHPLRAAGSIAADDEIVVLDSQAATLPEGWVDRLVRIRNENTDGVTGACLEPHDLLLSKCAANREKDRDFVAVAVSHGLADPSAPLERLPILPVDAATRARIEQRIRALARPDGGR